MNVKRYHCTHWTLWLICLLGCQAANALGEIDVDASFGNAGRFAPTSGPNSVIALPDGRLLAVDFTADGVRLMRTDVAGHVDADFGAGGKVMLSFLRNLAFQTPSAMVAAPDGWVYLASGDSLTRFSVTGAVDLQFGQGGWVIWPPTDVDSRYLAIESIAPLADGGVAVLVAYYSSPYLVDDGCSIQQRLFLLQANGQIDPAFRAGGALVPGNISSTCWPHRANDLRQLARGSLRYNAPWNLRLFDLGGALLQTDIRLRLPGAAYYLYENNFSMVLEPAADREFDYVLRDGADGASLEMSRLHKDGTLDLDFGSTRDGRVVLEFPAQTPEFFIADAAVEAGSGSGKYVYVTAEIALLRSSGRYLIIIRLLRDGRLDTTFGDGGLAIVGGVQSSARVIMERNDGSALLQLQDGTVMRVLQTAPVSGWQPAGTSFPAQPAPAPPAPAVSPPVPPEHGGGSVDAAGFLGLATLLWLLRFQAQQAAYSGRKLGRFGRCLNALLAYRRSRSR